MKFTGEVYKLRSTGDSLRVTVTNVKRKTAAAWMPYGENLEFDVPFANQRTYPVGKTITVEIKAK